MVLEEEIVILRNDFVICRNMYSGVRILLYIFSLSFRDLILVGSRLVMVKIGFVDIFK